MRPASLKGLSLARRACLRRRRAQAQIKIGVAGPITGPNASFGAQLTTGVEQAAADFNAAGGILGQKIEIEQGDDVSDPKQGVSVANKFVGDGVKFVVGHFNSGVTIPASEVYADNGVALHHALGHQSEGHRSRLVGRVPHLRPRRPAGQAVGRSRADQAQGQEDRHRPRQDPLRPGPRRRRARGFMNAGGKKEVLYEGVNTGEKDYSAIVSKIKASGADYLMWGGLHTEGGLIVRQMRDQGMKTIMISGDGITDTEFASIGGPGVEGTLMSFGPEPRNNPTPRTSSPKSRPRASSRKATRSIPTPRCRSSSRRPRRPTRSTRRRSRKSCIPAWRSHRDRRHLLRREGRPHHRRLRLVRLEEGAPTARSISSRCEGAHSPQPFIRKRARGFAAPTLSPAVGRPSGRPSRPEAAGRALVCDYRSRPSRATARLQRLGRARREVGQHAVGAGALEAERGSPSSPRRSSSQPFCAAALSIAYSPLTW